MKLWMLALASMVAAVPATAGRLVTPWLSVAQFAQRAQVAQAPVTRLADLRDLDELKTLFNHDRGKVRLVLLLSPT